MPALLDAPASRFDHLLPAEDLTSASRFDYLLGDSPAKLAEDELGGPVAVVAAPVPEPVSRFDHLIPVTPTSETETALAETPKASTNLREFVGLPPITPAPDKPASGQPPGWVEKSFQTGQPPGFGEFVTEPLVTLPRVEPKPNETWEQYFDRSLVNSLSGLASGATAPLNAGGLPAIIAAVPGMVEGVIKKAKHPETKLEAVFDSLLIAGGAAAGARAGLKARSQSPVKASPEGETPLVAPPVEPVTTTEVTAHPTVEVPLERITFSKDVPQFKAGADERGIVEPIAGTYERIGTAPVQIWERTDGAMELVSGRHRLDLAQRTGEKSIPAQIHREADGFTAERVAMLDAELNIRDNQGSAADYASYFKHSGIEAADAQARGLLARTKGKSGFSIALEGSEDLFGLHQSGRLGDAAATAIARAAPGDAGAQAVGIRAALEGRSGDFAANLIKAARERTEQKPQTSGDLFQFDDTAMREMEAQARRASEAQRELREQISAVQGAAKKPELAAKLGVNVADPAAVQARIGELRTELARWEDWPMHPDLVARTRGVIASDQPLPTKTTTTGPEPLTPEATATRLQATAEKATAASRLPKEVQGAAQVPRLTALSEIERTGLEHLRRAGSTLNAAGRRKLKELENRAIAQGQLLPEQPFNLAGETAARSPVVEPKAPTPAEGTADLFGAQGAISTPGPPLATLSPAPVFKTPKSQREIITALAKGLGVPVRFGRLRTSKFAGYFMPRANLIGSKRANDIPVVTHEAGHKLDAEFRLSGEPAIASELDILGDPGTPGSRSSWTKSKSNAYKMGEGVAEFVRHWLTDPAKAKADAPQTHARFETVLAANKDFADVLRTAQEDIRLWRTAEPQARLRSSISVGTNPNQTRYTLSQLTRDLVDDLHILRLAVDDAQKMAGKKLLPSQNPYLLARNLRGSYGMADTFIRQGVTDFRTREVTLGTSLQDALSGVGGRVNDFRDWIVAKRAQELTAQGRETGLQKADIDFVAKKFDGDAAFQEAFAKVKAWNDALLQYSVDAGLTTPEGAAAMRALNEDYVPFHRLFEVGAGEAPSLEGGGIGRGLNIGKPGSLKGMRGSVRDILDPLETMVRNAYTLITASEKAAIHGALADLASAKGMGKWIEQVKTPQRMVQASVEKLRKQLEEAGTNLDKVPDDLILKFFQNSGQAPFGENIIRVFKNGEAQFYRLNRDLFDTFHALDMEDAGKLVQILSSQAQLLRSGVVLAPDFALANALRDTFSGAIISRYGAVPFQTTLRGVAALLKDKKLVTEWAASGGESAIEANYFDRTKLQKFLNERITKDLSPAEQAMVYAKSPLVALRHLTGLSETATRLGEYKAAYDKLVKSGMPEGEARRLAAFEARDRQDFAKGGAKTKILRRLVPFANAALQGNIRLAQAFRENPIGTTLKGLGFITSIKLLEQAVNYGDEDYWDRPQWERDLFFLIPAGQREDGHTRFMRIPVPFEAGIIFATFPGRLIQFARERDPEALKSVLGTFVANTVPNPMPPAAKVVFEDFLSGKQGWDMYRNRPIVPESLKDMPADLQWTEQTSLLARNLGKTLGYSPIKIDHLIGSTTGGVGKQLTHNVIDPVIAQATGEKRTATGKLPGGRFVTTPAAVSSQAMEDFYSTLERLREEKNREKAGQPNKPEKALTDLFESRARKLSSLRKEMRATSSAAKKAKYQEEILQLVRTTMERYKGNNILD